jgi:hypothetical protein
MIHDSPATKDAAMSRIGRGIEHPVLVCFFDYTAGRFEIIEAVNYAAAQELVEKINGKKAPGDTLTFWTTTPGGKAPDPGLSVKGRRWPVPALVAMIWYRDRFRRRWMKSLLPRCVRPMPRT